MTREVLIHDPRLARAVYAAARPSLRNKSYQKWLNLVKQVAEALDIEFVNPYDKHRGGRG